MHLEISKNLLDHFHHYSVLIAFLHRRIYFKLILRFMQFYLMLMLTQTKELLYSFMKFRDIRENKKKH